MIKPKERDLIMEVLDTCDPAMTCGIGNREIDRVRDIIERESKPLKRGKK